MQKSPVTIEWEGTRKDTLTETAVFDGTEACLGKILGRPLMYPSIKLPNNSLHAAGRSYYTFYVSARNRGLRPHMNIHRLGRWMFNIHSAKEQK